MMGFFRSIAGTVTLDVTGADLPDSLSRISAAGIAIFDVQESGDLTAQITVLRKDYRRIEKILSGRGDVLSATNRQGIYWGLKGLLKRPVLTFGILFLLVLALYLPSRVLFVRVEGNQRLPANLILSSAEDCGIIFGASRRAVRSEKVKNALLGKVPELQWVGVNTYGCVAVISVRERALPEAEPEMGQVSSIVADRDGVILDMTVTNGNGLCAVGQAVRAGDILISGFTDCGLCVTATRAEGEIMARTRRDLTVLTPSEALLRGRETGQKTKISLIIGNYRINFYKGSGISDAGCVKMYTEYCLTLPGGLELPLKLAKETFTGFEQTPQPVSEESVLQRMTAFGTRYLRSLMVAGTVTDRTEELREEGGAWCLAGEYACTEMIGRVQTEEIGVIP